MLFAAENSCPEALTDILAVLPNAAKVDSYIDLETWQHCGLYEFHNVARFQVSISTGRLHRWNQGAEAAEGEGRPRHGLVLRVGGRLLPDADWQKR